MPNIVEYGYLNTPYLSYPYLTAVVDHGVRSQVELVISANHEVNEQIEQVIADQHSVNEQIDRYLDALHQVNEQIEIQIDATHTVLEQIDQAIASSHTVNEQIDQAINSTHTVLEQIEREINATHAVASQIELNVGEAHVLHTEIKRGYVLHIDHCEGYLATNYLELPYLTDNTMCAQMRSQVERRIDATHIVYSQIERQIDTTKAIKSQIERRIDTSHTVLEQIARLITFEHEVNEQVERRIDATHTIKSQIERRIDVLYTLNEQIERLQAHILACQITQVLYNTTQLRILCDFASRGTSGLNWTANTTATGDFSANNLNTDIVEQVWRSATSVLTGIQLVVDTEVVQGVFVDTMAILNHNMTTSASITWQGSNDPGFATIGFTESLASTATNIYYIAPTLPTESFRYWRFLVDDLTNPGDYIQWGTVVFGSAAIFQGECFVDRVLRSRKHFADKIPTEGYTNTSNDRALKYGVSLEFRNLKYLKGNYNRLVNVFETARTSLKCLWIPTPQYPSRFATFGKLVDIPVEEHNVKGALLDFVNFEITVDESL